MSGNGLVTPGQQAVDIICAEDPFGILLLREIARPQSQLQRHPRVFGTWDNGFCTGWVFLNGRAQLHVTLRVGRPSGHLRTLFIEDVRGNGLSLKPVSNGNGVLTLQVDSTLCLRRLQSFANQLVGAFVVHGYGWQDRNGREYYEPHGAEPLNDGRKRRPRKRRNSRHQRYLHPLTDG